MRVYGTVRMGTGIRDREDGNVRWDRVARTVRWDRVARTVRWVRVAASVTGACSR